LLFEIKAKECLSSKTKRNKYGGKGREIKKKKEKKVKSKLQPNILPNSHLSLLSTIKKELCIGTMGIWGIILTFVNINKQ
jgi:hypothetical protein